MPDYLRHREDDFNVFAGTVRRKLALGDVDELENVRINRRVITRLVSERTFTAVKRAAIDGGVVVQTAGHSAGRKSAEYRIADPYLEEPIRHVEVTDLRMFERIVKEQQRLRQEQLTRMLPVHLALVRIQRERLRVTSDADAILSGLPEAYAERAGQATLVRRLRTGVWPFSRTVTGRFFTPFCNLRRDIRPFVHLGGSPIGGYDIRRAQPAMLAILRPELSRGLFVLR